VQLLQLCVGRGFAYHVRPLRRACVPDVDKAPGSAREVGGRIERGVDSVYLAEGRRRYSTRRQLERIFAAVQSHFEVQPDAEITVECAPGTLTQDMLEVLLRMWGEPRQPGRAVVCRSGSSGCGPLTQADDGARRHLSTALLRELPTSMLI